jgi:hypothetical protein
LACRRACGQRNYSGRILASASRIRAWFERWLFADKYDFAHRLRELGLAIWAECGFESIVERVLSSVGEMLHPRWVAVRVSKTEPISTTRIWATGPESLAAAASTSVLPVANGEAIGLLLIGPNNRSAELR